MKVDFVILAGPVNRRGKPGQGPLVRFYDEAPFVIRGHIALDAEALGEARRGPCSIRG